MLGTLFGKLRALLGPRSKKGTVAIRNGGRLQDLGFSDTVFRNTRSFGTMSHFVYLHLVCSTGFLT